MKNYSLSTDDSIMLMIDIQERLVPAMYPENKAIEVNGIMLQAFKEMGVPIIYTEQYPKGLGRTVPSLLEHLQEEKPLEKVVFSAYNDELKSLLIASGRKNIILTGMESHVCVFQTARDLLNDGYNVFVVTDGVASRTAENLRSGFELMKDVGAVITNMETVLFDLLKKAGSPEFKLVSKLIK
jgi:nicotinamidase-related amidase